MTSSRAGLVEQVRGLDHGHVKLKFLVAAHRILDSVSAKWSSSMRSSSRGADGLFCGIRNQKIANLPNKIAQQP